MRRLVFVVNNVDFLRSHRLVLATGARDAGYDVHVIAPETESGWALRSLGLEFHPWRLSRSGSKGVDEARSVATLTNLYRLLQPSLVHHITIKPIIYGSIAARVMRVPAVVNAVSGLGYIFMAPGWRARTRRSAVVAAYRLALNGAGTAVVLQNRDDERELRNLGALSSRARVTQIQGSGVDLSRFQEQPLPSDSRPLVVLPARLLNDKGVREFVEAARILKRHQVSVRMALVGGLDAGNPSAVTQTQLDGWLAEGVVEAWGHQSDMAQVFAQASIVCLPSYREGVPKALLEAAAIGRPIVTTDAPGCRDVVDHGRLGTLVPVKDSERLAEALERLIADPTRRAAEGRALAEHARAHFSEAQVLAQHLALYESLLGR